MSKRGTMGGRAPAPSILDRYRVPPPSLPPEMPRGRRTFLLMVFARAATGFLAAVEASRTAEGLDAAYRSAASELSQALGAIPTNVDFEDGAQGAKIACGKGCDHCCAQRVVVTPVVALSMARTLRKKLSEEAMASLLARLEAFEEGAASLSPLERHFRTAMCPVNQDGLCLAYRTRPLVCQGYHSFDLGACIDARNDPHKIGGVLMDSQRVEIRNVALVAVASATAALGLNIDALELAPALRIALETPDAAERYLAGEPIFAPAHRPEISQARDAYRREGVQPLPMHGA